jgi:hypothetical protein
MAKKKVDPNELIYIGFRLPRSIIQRAVQSFQKERDSIPPEYRPYRTSDHYRKIFSRGLESIEATK